MLFIQKNWYTAKTTRFLQINFHIFCNIGDPPRKSIISFIRLLAAYC